MKTKLLMRLTATLLAALLLGAAPAVLAQKAERIVRVATLWSTTRAVAQPYIEEVEGGLRELGWVKGRNLAIEHFCTDANPERLPVVAAELVAWKPDVAIASLNTGAFAIKRLTGTLPIVVSISFDPVGVGLAASLARPGGKVTGMAAVSLILIAKKLQMLRELVPGARRVGVIWNTEFPGNRSSRNAMDSVASDLHMTVVDGGVGNAGSIATVFEPLAKGRIDALFVIQDNLTFLRRREIIEAAARNGWPAIYGSHENCDEGGLVCYGLNMPAQFRRSAVFVDRILRGADPAAIPFEQPMTFDIVINLKTARTLNLTVPQSLLMMATRVIE